MLKRHLDLDEVFNCLLFLGSDLQRSLILPGHLLPVSSTLPLRFLYSDLTTGPEEDTRYLSVTPRSFPPLVCSPVDVPTT